MTAKKVVNVSAIAQVRALLKEFPIGTEVSFKTVTQIQGGQGSLSTMRGTGELDYKRMHTDPDGGRPYKIWATTGKEPTANKCSVYQKNISDYVLLCGRTISSLPKGSVKVHRMN